MLDLDDIIFKIQNGDYEPKLRYPKRPEGYGNENYVYDENETVIWNRKHRIELEDNYRRKLEEYHNAINSKEKEFSLDLSKAIHGSCELSVPIVDLIVSLAWEKGHDCGMEEVVNEVYELVDFAEYVVNHAED